MKPHITILSLLFHRHRSGRRGPSRGRNALRTSPSTLLLCRRLPVVPAVIIVFIYLHLSRRGFVHHWRCPGRLRDALHSGQRSRGGGGRRVMRRLGRMIRRRRRRRRRTLHFDLIEPRSCLLGGKFFLRRGIGVIVPFATEALHDRGRAARSLFPLANGGIGGGLGGRRRRSAGRDARRSAGVVLICTGGAGIRANTTATRGRGGVIDDGTNFRLRLAGVWRERGVAGRRG